MGEEREGSRSSVWNKERTYTRSKLPPLFVELEQLVVGADGVADGGVGDDAVRLAADGVEEVAVGGQAWLAGLGVGPEGQRANAAELVDQQAVGIHEPA